MSSAKFFLRFAIFMFVAGLMAALSLKVMEVRHSYLDITVSPRVVSLTPASNSLTGGTGFVVQADSGTSYLLTNAHVCRLAEQGMLVARGDDTVPIAFVNIVEISTVSDLCLLTSIPDITGLKLASDQGFGEQLTTIGHPYLESLTHSLGFATNRQRITLALAQNITQWQCESEYYGVYFANYEEVTSLGILGTCYKVYNAIRTSMVIYPGNSGSPVVNMWGHVVGVLFASDNYNNYGYIVPLQDISNFLKDR